MPIHFCMNCQKETEFKNGHCPYCFDTHDTCSNCGGPMAEYDNNMNEGKHCPKDCEFEIVVGDLQDEPHDDGPTEQPVETYYYDEDYNLSDINQPKAYLSYCWHCKKKTIDSSSPATQRDKVKIFGYICSLCNNSIREDPKLLRSIKKYLGISDDKKKMQYLEEIVDDLKRLSKY